MIERAPVCQCDEPWLMPDDPEDFCWRCLKDLADEFAPATPGPDRRTPSVVDAVKGALGMRTQPRPAR